MEREQVLNLIQTKEWIELLEVLKDNVIFDRLSEDHIFQNVFDTYFIQEFINHDTKEDRILELTAIHTFHKSERYNFCLSEGDYQKLLVLLIERTEEYRFAIELPELELSKRIIADYERKTNETVEKTIRDHEIKTNFDIYTFEKSDESFVISIFKSPQEEEFFRAAEVVFLDSILLPNAALSTVINNNVLSRLEGNNRHFFLSTTVDLVVVDCETKLPTHFFELDSKFHDAEEQKKKDEIKNKLISEAGFELHRIRKKTQDAGMENYITFLNKILTL